MYNNIIEMRSFTEISHPTNHKVGRQFEMDDTYERIAKIRWRMREEKKKNKHEKAFKEVN